MSKNQLKLLLAVARVVLRIAKGGYSVQNEVQALEEAVYDVSTETGEHKSGQK